MKYQHRDLAAGNWRKLSFIEQMANIGSEIERTIIWKAKGNQEYSRLAFNRSLELIDLTLEARYTLPRLRELARAREMLVDYFCGNNSYHSSDTLWRKYFFAFTWAAAKNRSLA